MLLGSKSRRTAGSRNLIVVEVVVLIIVVRIVMLVIVSRNTVMVIAIIMLLSWRLCSQPAVP